MSFSIEPTRIPDVLLVRTTRHVDSRGCLTESFRACMFDGWTDVGPFVQENQVASTNRGTLRGLHFQVMPYTQAKLVRVLRGSIFDVAVDLRAGSETFGRWVGATLSASGGEQLYVPYGFAHAYCTLTADCDVLYKCDRYYVPAAERGINPFDPAVGIEWPLDRNEITISNRDLSLPSLNAITAPF